MEDALAADVNAIMVAYEGRVSMFETIGWIERKKNEPVRSGVSAVEWLTENFG